MKQRITTEAAPAAVGPYSQAIVCGEFMFVSGQLGLDPATGDLISSSVIEQTVQALSNMRAILETAGTSMDSVVKATIYVTNLSDFAAVNDAYSQFFSEPTPARACVEVAALPKGGLVEIEAVAHLPGDSQGG